MRLRRFEAATVAEALAQVREDLGEDAVILRARAHAPGVAGVDVLAAVDEPAERRAPSAPRRDGVPGAECRAPRRGASYPGSAECRVPSVVERRNLGPESSAASGEEDDDRIAEIRRLLLELTDTSAAGRLPEALRPAHQLLCRREVPPRVATRLVRRRAGRGTGLATLPARLAGAFRVGGLVVPGSRQRRVALVGPTGVGKTTTMAKLAGQFRRAGGRGLALLTVDTYRIGAVAQLQIYADLLGARLHVVRTPGEMQAALAAEAAAELILVDTMGRSPRHQEGIRAIRPLLAAIPGLEVHLVLSATTKASDVEEGLRRFRPLGYHHVLVSKVDEAASCGPLLGAALEHDLSISYLAVGQEVPDDLEPATPRGLAHLLVQGARC